MFWKENFLKASGTIISNQINKFQYKIAGTWKNVEIKSTVVDGNKQIFTIEFPVFESGTITEIRFLDKNNTVVGEKNENIIKESGYSLLMQISFYLYEGEV